jgi:predicted enzyme related to lactoylglutathione lyase
VQLTSSDVTRSRAFYSRLFGWVTEEPSQEFGGYFTFTKDGVAVAGGMGAVPGEAPSDTWSVYLATDDAAKTTELAAQHGGQVLVAPMTVGTLGTMAFYADPGGATIGAWQSDEFPGQELIGETGTPSWFELHTTSYEPSLAFYRDVFGWHPQPVSDEPAFRYSVLRNDVDMLAGVMDATDYWPEGEASRWAVYVRVDDTDAALARAVELGGQVVDAAQDTPYGRLATAADSTGAMFKLLGTNLSAAG